MDFYAKYPVDDFSGSGSTTVFQGTVPWIVDGSGFTQPISGTVTALQGTSPWVVTGTITTSPDVNIHDSAGLSLGSNAGSLFVEVTNTVPVSQSGVWTTGRTWNLNCIDDFVNICNFPTSFEVTQGTTPWTVDGTVDVGNFPAIQPVSQSGAWTVTALQGTTPWIVDASGFTVPVIGPLTDAELRASPVPISGTITALQGTSPWVVSGSITTSPNVNVHDGSGVSIGSVSDSLKVNVTNTVPVTGPLTDTQLRATPVPVSVSNFPATVAVTQSTTPWIVNGSGFTQPISGTVTALQGTSPWVVSGSVTTSPDVNIHDGAGNSLTSQVNGSQRALDIGIDVAGVQIDPRQIRLLTASDVVSAVQSGTWTVQQGGAPWSVTGPLTDTQLRATPVPVSVSNFPATVAVTQSTSPWVVSGTVAATQSGTWTTGRTWALSSGTDSVAAVQSGAWAVSVSNFPADADALAQGSTTSGQLGALVMGAVTTAAPSYTTAQTSPLSLDTSGNLRIAGTVTASPIGFSTPSNTRPTVTTTSSTILAANSARRYVVITNNDVRTVWIKLGATAVASQGIGIPANGNYEILSTNLWTGTIQAIVSASTAVLDIFEGT